MTRLEKETAVLSSVLYGSQETVESVRDIFTKDLFEPPEHRELAGVIREFIEIGKKVNVIEIRDKHPELVPLITSIGFGQPSLNGKLRDYCSSLKNKRPEPKPAHVEPQVKTETGPERTSLPTLNEYLSRVEMFLERYVAFPSIHESPTLALWVAHAWIVERFEVSPILAVTSAEMRSGKTRVLDCVELMVPHSLRMVQPSEAAIYSLLAQRPRHTLLLDEVDAIFGTRPSERTEGIRAILNSGNMQGTPVHRVSIVKGERRVEPFDCYGAKAAAGIGKLPPTVSDRAVHIRMRRRSPDELIVKFRRKVAKVEAQELYFDFSGTTLATDIAVPDELNDRAADSWEPLLAIADAAGGDWPARARRATVALTIEEDDPSVGMKLLADIRGVFADEVQLETTTLLNRLHNLEASPWGDWYGKPLTARGLAKLLEPYRVRPAHRRIGQGTIRGYFIADFADAFKRYVPARVTGTSGTSGTTEDDVPDVSDVPLPEEEDAERDMRIALQEGD